MEPFLIKISFLKISFGNKTLKIQMLKVFYGQPVIHPSQFIFRKQELIGLMQQIHAVQQLIQLFYRHARVSTLCQMLSLRMEME